MYCNESTIVKVGMLPQMGDIQRRCESLAAGLLGNEDVLDRALSLTAGHRESGAYLMQAIQEYAQSRIAAPCMLPARRLPAMWAQARFNGFLIVTVHSTATTPLLTCTVCRAYGRGRPARGMRAAHTGPPHAASRERHFGAPGGSAPPRAAGMHHGRAAAAPAGRQAAAAARLAAVGCCRVCCSPICQWQ